MDLSVSQITILSLPLIITLFSLAFMPLISHKFWSKYEIPTLSFLATISAILTFSSIRNAELIFEHTIVEDYIPFIIMLFTLYVLANGIHIKINATANTLNNAIFIGLCSVFASFIGTTGASMLCLKPFLHMNRERKHQSHLIIFFIFLVSNIGGLLSPLGDPPLLLGYLHGIKFFWPLNNLFSTWLFYIIACLSIFAIIDQLILRKREDSLKTRKVSVEISGKFNIFFILLTVFILFIDIHFSIYIFSIRISPMCFKNLILLTFCVLSIRNSSKHKLDLAPFKEVAFTFLIIFIVISPVIFILNQYSDGIHKFIIDMGTSDNYGANVYFWLCGLASSFLDNAPSYLLFFNMVGESAESLMYIYTQVLKAISISSVVMGSITYIGNAPNMLVLSVAMKHGIKMPSFIGYMGWSLAIILPLSFIITLFL